LLLSSSILTLAVQSPPELPSPLQQVEVAPNRGVKQ
jgi:hypothetical protein